MTEVDSLGTQLYRYLVEHMYSVEPLERRRCAWVMNTEWLKECQKLAADLLPAGIPLWAADYTMLGLPILEPRDDGGVPHLEVID